MHFRKNAVITIRHEKKKTHPANSWISLKLQRQDGAVGLTLTHKVPNEHRLLEESGRLEAVMEELLQRSHQAVLPTQQHRQAASLRRHKQQKLRYKHQVGNRKSPSHTEIQENWSWNSSVSLPKSTEWRILIYKVGQLYHMCFWGFSNETALVRVTTKHPLTDRETTGFLFFLKMKGRILEWLFACLFLWLVEMFDNVVHSLPDSLLDLPRSQFCKKRGEKAFWVSHFINIQEKNRKRYLNWQIRLNNLNIYM